MEDTVRGIDIRRCGETIWDTVGAIRDGDWRDLETVKGEEPGYRNRKRVKKGATESVV